jgi:D-alanyl-D-alanine carboxypeptidase
MNLRRRTRIIAVFLCLAAYLASAFPVSAEDELTLASEAAVLMDADTGTVLYQKNMHEVLYPASITKIMTAYLAVQELHSDQVLTVSSTAVNAVSRTSSHISLTAGEQLTAEQALYALGMESANDAANVLAEAVAGSLEAFAEQMTAAARSLGAENTNFANANGLPNSEHYTTAYDMALITAAAWKVEGLAKYFSTVNYTLPATNMSDARIFQNKDRLLEGGQYYYEGVQMAKTGWTTAAQGTFAAVVTQGDVTLVVVTMKSPQLEDKYKDTHKLLDYGFSHYSAVTVSGETVTSGLELGKYSAVSGQKLLYLIPSEYTAEDITFSIDLPDYTDPRRTSITAAVYASIGELRLPDKEIKLQRPAEERKDFTISQLLQGEAQSVQDVVQALRIPGIVLLALCAAALPSWLHHMHVRHRRRRRLKAKIRRMKKKME